MVAPFRLQGFPNPIVIKSVDSSLVSHISIALTSSAEYLKADDCSKDFHAAVKILGSNSISEVNSGSYNQV